MHIKLAKLLLIAALAAGCAPSMGNSSVSAAGKYEATWESLKKYEAPEWFKDAKFGIFIHWGVYAVPAKGSEWYPRQMYDKNDRTYHHHRSVWGEPSEFGYKDMVPLFRAENWDPAAWAKLFKDAGATYVIPTGEHHDGFVLWDSKLTPWTATKKGPKRDLIGDLAKAVRGEGLKFGIS